MISAPLVLLWSSSGARCCQMLSIWPLKSPLWGESWSPTHCNQRGSPAWFQLGLDQGLSAHLSLEWKPLRFPPYSRITFCWGLPLIWDNAYKCTDIFPKQQLLENVSASVPWIINSDHFRKKGVHSQLFLERINWAWFIVFAPKENLWNRRIWTFQNKMSGVKSWLTSS